MNLKFTYLSLICFISTFSQVQQKNTVQKDSFYTATADTLFDDNNNYTTDNSKGMYMPEGFSEDFYVRQQLKLAENYVERMKYTEAAELYGTVLENVSDNTTNDLLRLTGNIHYLNNNMVSAAAFYDELFLKDKNNMSSIQLYKYSRALENIGKYNRATKMLILSKRRQRQEEKEAITNKINTTTTPPKEIRFKIENMNINRENSDFSPVYYGDGKLLFSSAESQNSLQDLYEVELNPTPAKTESPKKLSESINSENHETAAIVSSDGNRLYLTRSFLIKKLNRSEKISKIYCAKKVNGKWSNPKPVSFASDFYSTGHPALSSDGKKLYFVSDMPGSMGKTDIFLVDIYKDDTFSSPKNLGPKINTEHDELFPFVTDQKLYFSSNGYGGLGGLDIYEVPFEEEKIFGKIKNMGEPINSDKDDYSLIINEKNQNGFFASDRPGGKGSDDIYSFTSIIPKL